MSIKLVAVDIDGTLLTPEKELTDQVKAAVKEATQAGVQVVITTGRPVAGVKHLLKELELDQPNHYVITFNGALVQDASNGQELVKDTLSYRDYLDIEYYSRLLGVHMHAITKEGIYTANRDIGRYSVHESQLVNMPLFYRTSDEMKNKEIIKTMYIDEPEVLDRVIAQLPASFYERFTVVKSAPFYLEILGKKANKGHALEQLATELNLTMDQVMAIGDEENDIAMLEVAGHPVVMENGNPKVKKLAKHITKSNKESGVAYALRKWVLN